ncbi:MAG TPA: sugar ABC transporter ATP-binding protein [Ruminiclostridium sp.]
MPELLRLENIVKTFPGVLALSDMDFSLYSGEIHAICGENGAGKSTLMKVVTGVYKPDSGFIYVNGENQNFNNPNQSFAKGISIIYQETSLFEEMTVLENLFLGHEKQKKVMGFLPVLDYYTMEQDVKRIFKMLNTKIDLSTKIKELGMAQKQMVEIAKALTFDSKILILDEPTASLTQREVDALFEIIRKLRTNGVGIVYISHRLEEIFEVCDRVTVIRDGKYISTKNVNETNKDALVADMVGRSMNNYYPKTETEIGNELLRVEGLNVSGLLENISFNIQKGEIVGFAGLAGSGRTELAQALCGFIKKSSGKVYIDGKKQKIDNYNQAMDCGLVYVSEDRAKYGLVVDMSIKDNITMPQLKKYSKRSFIDVNKEKVTAEKYINEVGIKAPDSDFLVANLSGGNQQKVSVSKALALGPKLMILDEPTRGVDVNAKAEIHKIISELTAKHLTIFMISSELPELLGMCDRIYVMKYGRIAGCFNRAEATQEGILKLALEIKEG